MNKQVRNLYVVMHDNRVIHASTSLNEFVRAISQLITKTKSLSYYQKRFEKQDLIEHVDNLKKFYYFQKVK